MSPDQACTTQNRRRGPALQHCARRGVTLTEILIAMLVMAVGLVGLFALFPLGLLNVTRAVSLNRSEMLAHSAFSELKVQNLLAPQRYQIGDQNTGPLTPFVFDNPNLVPVLNPPPNWVGQRTFTVVIDPLWRWSNPTVVPPNNRFGRMDLVNNGNGAIGSDGNVDPNALGLQRVIPTDGIDNDFDGFVDASDRIDAATGMAGQDGIPDFWPDWNEPFLSAAQSQLVFAGRDDLVFREDNPALPLIDTTNAQLVSDRNYTWMVTARLTNVDDPFGYDVSIVTFFNRDLNNEQVFPAVYLPDPSDPTGATPSNQVIIRWPPTTAEPDIPRSGWVFDATNGLPQQPQPHRGYWYHFLQHSDGRGVDWNGDGIIDEMHMTLTLDAPAREVTSPIQFNELLGSDTNNNGVDDGLEDGLDNNNNGLVDFEDVAVVSANTNLNVAVIIPGVISVYNKTVRAQ